VTPINNETLANVAKWLGWNPAYCEPKVMDGPGVYVYPDHCGVALYKVSWMLTPQGRDAIERRLIEMGHQLTMGMGDKSSRYSIWAVGVLREAAGAKGDTPAVALVAAVAKLAEGSRQ
jgi:hypothetical protein